MCLEAGRGPKCCLVFSKCLDPQILVSEGGQESALHHYPQLLCQLCAQGWVRRQHSTQGGSLGKHLHYGQALMKKSCTFIHCKRLSLAPWRGKGQRKTTLQGTFRDLKHHRTDEAAANTWLERQHNSNYDKLCPVVAVVTPTITTTRKCSVNTVCQFQELSDTSLNVLLLFRMSLHHHFSPTKLSSAAVASSSRGSSSWRCT